MRSSRFLVPAMLLALLLAARSGHAWNSTQGPRLHGEANHGKSRDVVWFPVTGWSKDGTDGKKVFTRVAVDRGTLIPYDGETRLDPSELIGATVEALATDDTTRVKYRVAKMNPPPTGTPEGVVDPSNRTSYYTLIDDETKKPYCLPARGWHDDKPYPLDQDRGIQAVPVAQVWNRTGTEAQNSDHFTMACMAGAIAKCYRWGYQGWRHPEAVHYVQACTRMVMADYCGDGHAHTLEGTPIDLFDFVEPPGPVHPDTGAESGWSFETAWTGGEGPLPSLKKWGEAADATQGGGALCLSKKRWSTIPLTNWPSDFPPLPGMAHCPRLAKPPRTERATKTLPAWEPGLPCDYALEGDGDVNYRVLEKEGALLFNRSPFLDSLLTEATGTDREHWTSSASPTYADPVPLGSVLSVKTPKSVTKGLPHLVKLVTYYDGHDHLTTTQPPPASYPTGSGVVEGLIYACPMTPPAGSLRPLPRALQLVRDFIEAGSDYASGRAPPSPMGPVPATGETSPPQPTTVSAQIRSQAGPAAAVPGGTIGPARPPCARGQVTPRRETEGYLPVLIAD